MIIAIEYYVLPQKNVANMWCVDRFYGYKISKKNMVDRGQCWSDYLGPTSMNHM